VKAAEKARRRRARQKEDPERRMKAQEYERVKYLKRKEEGKIKKVAQMSSRERKAQREKWRKAQNKARGLAAVSCLKSSSIMEANVLFALFMHTYFQIQTIT
jgi:hypothetical protein